MQNKSIYSFLLLFVAFLLTGCSTTNTNPKEENHYVSWTKDFTPNESQGDEPWCARYALSSIYNGLNNTDKMTAAKFEQEEEKYGGDREDGTNDYFLPTQQVLENLGLQEGYLWEKSDGHVTDEVIEQMELAIQEGKAIYLGTTIEGSGRHAQVLVGYKGDEFELWNPWDENTYWISVDKFQSTWVNNGRTFYVDQIDTIEKV